MIKVGIYGASGYMGGEIIRILLEHPEVEVVWATSRSGQHIEHFHRNLYGVNMKLVKMEEVTPCDAVFVALPAGNAMNLVSKLLENDTRIIDLGADFRLKDQLEWEEIYKKKHSNWNIMNNVVYGIPEIYRESIRNAKVIANPGCFSSAAILGLSPLLKNNIVDHEKIVVDALSGTAGAGFNLNLSIHHPEIGNNIVPYNAVNHVHTYEIEQELSILANKKVSVHFTPAYVPITRGILAICHCFPKHKITREDILDLYKNFYRDEYFIKILDVPKDKSVSWQSAPYPWVAATSGTNFCHIGVDIDQKRNRIVVLCALDSLGKGGAQVGIQNLNIMFGLKETTGLKRYGLHPY